MANIKIKEIYRDMIDTKYGEKQSIKIVPHEETVTDVNGDSIELKGRRVSGFRDKNGETDKWVQDMTIKLQIVTNKSVGKEGDEMEWVNFSLPEGASSIVEEAPDPTDDF
jgi:hypothetical protein